MTSDFSNSILKTILKIAGLSLLIYVVYKVHILIIYLLIAFSHVVVCDDGSDLYLSLIHI